MNGRGQWRTLPLSMKQVNSPFSLTHRHLLLTRPSPSPSAEDGGSKWHQKASVTGLSKLYTFNRVEALWCIPR